MTCRTRIDPMGALLEISHSDHDELRKIGIAEKTAWSPKKEHPLAPLVAKFKAEVKKYYYWGQQCRCCYCSSYLVPNASTYHADHIVDKATYKNFTFELNNFGVACAVCNTHKGKKNVLTDKPEDSLTKLPADKDDYLIVHPHLDEWSDHLMFDGDGFIRSINSTGKGKNTIDICGIEAINFTKLAVKFSIDAREDAYRLMCELAKKRQSKQRREAMLSLLDRLAENTPQAEAAVKGLRQLLDALAAE